MGNHFKAILIFALTSTVAWSHAYGAEAVAIRDAYADSQDRFQMSCSFVVQGQTQRRSASLSRKAPEADMLLDGFRLRILVDFPSDGEAASQLEPVPFLFYNYDVFRGSENLVRRIHQKSALLTLPIDIPGESSESKCSLFPLPSDPISISDNGHELVHINVHPHDVYDSGNLLAGKIEPLLIDNRIKSFILLEGKKFPYAISAFLPAIVTSECSTLAMTFILTLDLIDSAERAQHEMVYERARAAGTPFVSFFRPDEMIALAREAGFKTATHISRAEIIKRYFSGRTDGLMPASGEEFVIATI